MNTNNMSLTFCPQINKDPLIISSNVDEKASHSTNI